MQKLLDKKSTLLIVEDDVDVSDMLRAYFHVRGYEVIVANWGEDAVQICSEKPIDIVLLDIRLPDIDGFEVANRLKTQVRHAELPVIFLTEQKERQFRVRGLELEAKDFITKPFDLEELHLRIRNTLQRSKLSTSQHSATALPIDEIVDERLLQWLEEPTWSLINIRLKNLGRFQEIYGYSATRELMHLVSRLLTDAIDKFEIQQGFVGHLSKMDFVLVIPHQYIKSMQAHLHRRLKKTFQYMSFVEKPGEDVYRDEKLSYTITLITHDNQVSDLASLKKLLT